MGSGSNEKGSELERARARLEQVKLSSWSQLVIKSARLLDEYLLEGIRCSQPELEGLRRTHLMLFPHISLEGERITTLAERIGVSKQAVGQLVDELEAMGMVERVKDPRDGRAKLVRFARGGQVMIEGVEGMRAAELGIEAGLEEGDGDVLRRILPGLIEELERLIIAQG
jgi:DNA-binding MarR family transcriptional regulator